MSQNKRKTLMIKRPSPSESDKPRPLPKVNVSESAAGATETDKIKPVASKTSKVKRPVPDDKGATARISLPDEAKIRKARRADDKDEKLPGASEIMDASKNATRQIEIDTEEVSQETQAPKIGDSDSWGNNDQTMQISADALETGSQDPVSKVKIDDHSKMTEQATRVATGQISRINDEDIHQDTSSKKQLEDADRELNGNNDQTMQIDADALRTGPIEKQELPIGDDDADMNDRTMQISADALSTGPIEKQLEEADAELKSNNDQTMEIDAEALQTANLSRDVLDEADQPDIMSQETMRMESLEEEEQPSAEDFNAATVELEAPDEKSEGGETGKIKDTFNAMTMAMDPSELARELEKDKTQPTPVSDAERNQTMDLSDVKPKTILIKRPSQNEAPSAPTVKTVRPDAQTVRTSRPAPGESQTAAGSDGKTVKLRRPGGAGQRPGAPVSRVASNAGLDISEDGSVTAKAKVKAPSLGPAWLALSVLTLVIMSGALWIALAIKMPELPMPGRIVNENNQILSLTS
ncbi:MAG: hypothetical protein JJU05_00420 [Verrucomicrobia bacterium]|nr:hypothetical protein [Verrucomicrobiota bacterium]MCH8526290.1 hypothetical protein [Kiritimatiellia bacterium]